MYECEKCGLEYSEVYMVNNDLWRRHYTTGQPCWDCFEAKIKRPLTVADLKPGIVDNYGWQLFLEGKIPRKHILRAVDRYLQSNISKVTISRKNEFGEYVIRVWNPKRNPDADYFTTDAVETARLMCSNVSSSDPKIKKLLRQQTAASDRGG